MMGVNDIAACAAAGDIAGMQAWAYVRRPNRDDLQRALGAAVNSTLSRDSAQAVVAYLWDFMELEDIMAVVDGARRGLSRVWWLHLNGWLKTAPQAGIAALITRADMLAAGERVMREVAACAPDAARVIARNCVGCDQLGACILDAACHDTEADLAWLPRLFPHAVRVSCVCLALDMRHKSAEFWASMDDAWRAHLADNDSPALLPCQRPGRDATQLALLLLEHRAYAMFTALVLHKPTVDIGRDDGQGHQAHEVPLLWRASDLDALLTHVDTSEGRSAILFYVDALRALWGQPVCPGPPTCKDARCPRRYRPWAHNPSRLWQLLGLFKHAFKLAQEKPDADAHQRFTPAVAALQRHGAFQRALVPTSREDHATLRANKVHAHELWEKLADWPAEASFQFVRAVLDDHPLDWALRNDVGDALAAWLDVELRQLSGRGVGILRGNNKLGAPPTGPACTAALVRHKHGLFRPAAYLRGPQDSLQGCPPDHLAEWVAWSLRASRFPPGRSFNGGKLLKRLRLGNNKAAVDALLAGCAHWLGIAHPQERPHYTNIHVAALALAAQLLPTLHLFVDEHVDLQAALPDPNCTDLARLAEDAPALATLIMHKHMQAASHARLLKNARKAHALHVPALMGRVLALLLDKQHITLELCAAEAERALKRDCVLFVRAMHRAGLLSLQFAVREYFPLLQRYFANCTPVYAPSVGPPVPALLDAFSVKDAVQTQVSATAAALHRWHTHKWVRLAAAHCRSSAAFLAWRRDMARLLITQGWARIDVMLRLCLPDLEEAAWDRMPDLVRMLHEAVPDDIVRSAPYFPGVSATCPGARATADLVNQFWPKSKVATMTAAAAVASPAAPECAPEAAAAAVTSPAAAPACAPEPDLRVPLGHSLSDDSECDCSFCCDSSDSNTDCNEDSSEEDADALPSLPLHTGAVRLAPSVALHDAEDYADLPDLVDASEEDGPSPNDILADFSPPVAACLWDPKSRLRAWEEWLFELSDFARMTPHDWRQVGLHAGDEGRLRQALAAQHGARAQTQPPTSGGPTPASETVPDVQPEAGAPVPDVQDKGRALLMAVCTGAPLPPLAGIPDKVLEVAKEMARLMGNPAVEEALEQGAQGLARAIADPALFNAMCLEELHSLLRETWRTSGVRVFVEEGALPLLVRTLAATHGAPGLDALLEVAGGSLKHAIVKAAWETNTALALQRCIHAGLDLSGLVFLGPCERSRLTDAVAGSELTCWDTLEHLNMLAPPFMDEWLKAALRASNLPLAVFLVGTPQALPERCCTYELVGCACDLAATPEQLAPLFAAMAECMARAGRHACKVHKLVMQQAGLRGRVDLMRVAAAAGISLKHALRVYKEDAEPAHAAVQAVTQALVEAVGVKRALIWACRVSNVEAVRAMVPAWQGTPTERDALMCRAMRALWSCAKPLSEPTWEGCSELPEITITRILQDLYK